MLGASTSGQRTEFSVWAPRVERLALRILDEAGARDYAMWREANGYFRFEVEAGTGDRYFYIPDGGNPVPDPVSRFLPDGVHGPTEIWNPKAFAWSDSSWHGISLTSCILYELHTGTFTNDGTFEGVIKKLDYLNDLGITAIELLPVAAFPGKRNWGYDGVSIYAVQESYGGPDGLKRLVNAAHQKGIAVVLDVVYNHLGNEGNYLPVFGPYFTSRHETPWGPAINYDDAGAEHVRSYVIGNALYWIHEYHLDGLRLDAVHTIKDDSARHILVEIQESVQKLAKDLDREVCVFAESDENDAKLLRPQEEGGSGLDAVWSDDFHHSIHSCFTGEQAGYYQDFGKPGQIIRALNEGFVFQGAYSKNRRAQRGSKCHDIPLERHIICLQNHDQVGNRAKGERLSHLVPPEAQKAAACLMLLAPQTPLIFMGEEYAEESPFQFFTDYGDAILRKAVALGRREEFKDFNWDEVPDPQDIKTFERSRLRWERRAGQEEMFQWYRTLIDLRKRYVVSAKRTCSAWFAQNSLKVLIPRTEPLLAIVVSLPGSGDIQSEFKDRATEILCSSGDGYEIQIFELNAGEAGGRTGRYVEDENSSALSTAVKFAAKGTC